MIYIIYLYNRDQMHHHHRSKLNDNFIVNINSALATTYTSSSDFVADLPFQLRSVKTIQVLTGNIPSTVESFLFMDIVEDREKKIYGGSGRRYTHLLRYDLPTVVQNKIDYRESTGASVGDIGTLSQLSIKLYTPFEAINSFGLDKLTTISFTAASPTNINTTVAHGLITGDFVHFRNFPNASTSALEQRINTDRFVITFVNATNFTIAVDLSGEASPQQVHGYLPTYPLGSHATVSNRGNVSSSISLLTATPGSTTITTATAHTLVSGQFISISGCDNCATVEDNNAINGNKYIIAVINPTTFTIPPVISSYVSPSQITGAPAAVVLGVGTDIYVDKFQCSFDIRINADMDIAQKKYI